MAKKQEFEFIPVGGQAFILNEDRIQDVVIKEVHIKLFNHGNDKTIAYEVQFGNKNPFTYSANRVFETKEQLIASL